MSTTIDARAEIGYGDHTKPIVQSLIHQTETHFDDYQISMQVFDSKNPTLLPLAQLSHFRLFQLGLGAVMGVDKSDTEHPTLARIGDDKALAYGTVLGIDILRSAVADLKESGTSSRSSILQKDTPAGKVVQFLSNGRLLETCDSIGQINSATYSMQKLLENLGTLFSLPEVDQSLSELRSQLLEKSGYNDPLFAKSDKTKKMVCEIIRQNPGRFSRVIFAGSQDKEI